MQTSINLDQIYTVSEGVVMREIDGEFIIVPIHAGIGDIEDEFYSMNQTGKMIIQKIDGKLTLSQIIEDLMVEYDTSLDEIQQDVLGFVKALVNRHILIQIS